MLDHLNDALSQVLPDAKLEQVEIPKANGLKLYLIDEHYPLSTLDGEAAERVMNNPLYWMFCWASGKAMAQFILSNPEQVKGKVVLDVGSGSGVVAIAAALAGASKVIASDIDEMSHRAISLNAELNQVDVSIVGDYRECQEAVDLITVADVLYDAENIPLLESLISYAPRLLLADARVKNFTHPMLTFTQQLPGETWPQLGGFDEFYEVNFYESK